MRDQWTDRLSEYLDGELSAGERSALEAHLATCADCSATLEDLRRVVARAKSLEDREPTSDLWPGVAQHIRRGRVDDRPVRRDRRRFSLTVPQLLAASVALVLLSSGGVWLALRPRAPSPLEQAIQQTGPATVQNVRWARTDAAVAELQDALARNESRLDTATVRVVRQSLAVIDKAIDQARRALAADPGNAYLNLHLASTMRRKVELLRRANELAAAQELD
jgi:anti-sigma factor RsiW